MNFYIFSLLGFCRPFICLYHLCLSYNSLCQSTFSWLFSSFRWQCPLLSNDHRLTMLCDTLIPSCTGLIFVSLGAVRALCLSFSMMAAHTYLLFYFEAWLTGWQAWHSCRRCGACYYAYINILINTWLAIEEIITCHHSTVRKEFALFYGHVCVCRCRFAHAVSQDLCSCCSPLSNNEFNSSSSRWKTQCRSL